MDEPIQAQMPTNTGGEWALTLAKAAAQLIPLAGGSAAEVLGAIVSPIIERRKTEWFESIARGLNDLSQHVKTLTPEALLQSETFTTAFLRASQIAITTHEQEKLEALRNAVLNVAKGDGPDDSLQIMFLDAVNTLTFWHLRLLDCIADIEGWSKRHEYPLHVPAETIDAATIFDAVYRDQLPAEDFHIQLLQDLYNRGLATNNTQFRSQMRLYDEKDTFPRITDLGRKFLAYISTPRMPESHEENGQPM